MKMESLLTDEEKKDTFLIKGFYDSDVIKINEASFIGKIFILCSISYYYSYEEKMSYLKGILLNVLKDGLIKDKSNVHLNSLLTLMLEQFKVAYDILSVFPELSKNCQLNKNQIINDNLIEITPDFKRNIPFKVGDSVIDTIYQIEGIGVIEMIDRMAPYPILAKIDGALMSYNINGKYINNDIYPRLFLENENPRLVINKIIKQENE